MLVSMFLCLLAVGSSTCFDEPYTGERLTLNIIPKFSPSSGLFESVAQELRDIKSSDEAKGWIQEARKAAEDVQSGSTNRESCQIKPIRDCDEARLAELTNILQSLDKLTDPNNDFATSHEGVKFMFYLTSHLAKGLYPELFLKAMSLNMGSLVLNGFMDLLVQNVRPQYDEWFANVNKTMDAMIEQMGSKAIDEMDTLIIGEHYDKDDPEYQRKIAHQIYDQHNLNEGNSYVRHFEDHAILLRPELAKAGKNRHELCYKTVVEVCENLGGNFYEQMTKYDVISRGASEDVRKYDESLSEEFQKLKMVFRFCGSVLGPDHREATMKKIRGRRQGAFEKLVDQVGKLIPKRPKKNQRKD